MSAKPSANSMIDDTKTPVDSSTILARVCDSIGEAADRLTIAITEEEEETGKEKIISL